MNTHWILRTNGDPLATSQKFLWDVWRAAGLDCMIFPRHTPGVLGARPFFASEWTTLDRADPFSPLMAANAARFVAQQVREIPHARLGAVLRPCEARALQVIARREALSLAHLLIVGVECLATFPEEDYEWRAARPGGEEALTREALRFAHVGGINAYRFRRACQVCASPVPQAADLSLDALGLPTRQCLLVAARDEKTAARLHLDEITGGEAPPDLIAAHMKVVAALTEQRARARDRMANDLPAALPTNVSEFVAHLENCAPCQACLNACPTYAGELARRSNGDGVSLDAVSRWLASCAGCGLCEEACPKGAPLTALISRMSRGLIGEWITQ